MIIDTQISVLDKVARNVAISYRTVALAVNVIACTDNFYFVHCYNCFSTIRLLWLPVFCFFITDSFLVNKKIQLQLV